MKQLQSVIRESRTAGCRTTARPRQTGPPESRLKSDRSNASRHLLEVSLDAREQLIKDYGIRGKPAGFGTRRWCQGSSRIAVGSSRDRAKIPPGSFTRFPFVSNMPKLRSHDR